MISKNESEAFSTLQLHLDAAKRITAMLDSDEDQTARFREHLKGTVGRLQNLHNVLDEQPMQKIVICTWAQEFSLPHEVIMRYAELKGIEIGVYGQAHYWETKNPNAVFILPKYTWVPYSEPGYLDNDYARYYLGAQQDSIDWREYEEFEATELDRTDPALVQAVEEFIAKLHGKSAYWKIIEIPDGVKWKLKHKRDQNVPSEFIGGEYIEEVRRVWR